jgi:hypothetical protein
MINKVVFFNYYHNGDLHLSRNFVSEVSKICNTNGISCEYYHKCNPDVLADLHYVKHTSNSYSTNDRMPSSVIGDILFINTWYCGRMDVYNLYGVSFKSIYMIFVDAVKTLGIDIEQMQKLDLFPSIDYNCFDIGQARNWIGENRRKKVFIANCRVMSGQSENFSFSEVINSISLNDDFDFLISNDEPGIERRKNVFMTSDIIKKPGCNLLLRSDSISRPVCDLNENSFLASNCDLIIGRLSGAYNFAITRENYFDNPKTFLCFTNSDENSYLWAKDFVPLVKAKVFGYNTTNQKSIINLINEKLDFQS